MKNEKPSYNLSNKYNLNESQAALFNWLKEKGLNTDENTLAYWSWKYPPKRVIEVIQFAHARRESGQVIRNIGGWVQKMLMTGMPVVNDLCKSNRDAAQRYVKENGWIDLSIYEKYVKDNVTNDDLPLTMSQDDFKRALEALHSKSLRYKDL
jgi:hypothetical protein